MYGLTTRDIKTIHSILRKYAEVGLVYIFGSRAKENFKKGSDIDLAIMNAGVSASTISKIKADLEESSLPYFVDVLNYQETKHREIKEHIDRVGVEFYNALGHRPENTTTSSKK